VRFIDKSSPLEEEGRELKAGASLGKVKDDERPNNGPFSGLVGVAGELSIGDVGSSDGDDVVLALVLAVADGVAASGATQPDGRATSPSTTRLSALLGRCGPFEARFGQPNQLLRRADLGAGAMTAAASVFWFGGEGSGAIVGGVSAMASGYYDEVKDGRQAESKAQGREQAPRTNKGGG
jgi:hypothetical protein